jgi:hypothetical protein
VVFVEFEILCLLAPKTTDENDKHLQSQQPISGKVSLTWISRPRLSNRMLSLRISLTRSFLGKMLVISFLDDKLILNDRLFNFLPIYTKICPKCYYRELWGHLRKISPYLNDVYITISQRDAV